MGVKWLEIINNWLWINNHIKIWSLKNHMFYYYITHILKRKYVLSIENSCMYLEGEKK
jgi:hypothetical protein